MQNNILFVFEGSSAEVKIKNNLTKYFLQENTVVHCSFCSDIYQLHSKIMEDDDLDVFELLKVRDTSNPVFKKFNRGDFAEIYLFFDYDGHATKANDNSIKELLEVFSNETEKGKLYISYPMVEAIKHINDTLNFENLCVEAKGNIRYKELVGKDCKNEFQNLNSLTNENWKEIIELHIKKMNKIVYNKFDPPSEYITQLKVFEQQLAIYIQPQNLVAVLSGFPIFILDYYGNEHMVEILNS